MALLKGRFCHDPQQLGAWAMRTELRTHSYGWKSRSPAGWLMSFSTPTSHEHYNITAVATSHFPSTHTSHLFSSCTLLILSTSSGLASFHLHLFKPTQAPWPSSVPLLYETSRSAQPEMSSLSTEQPYHSDYNALWCFAHTKVNYTSVEMESICPAGL